MVRQGDIDHFLLHAAAQYLTRDLHMRLDLPCLPRFQLAGRLDQIQRKRQHTDVMHQRAVIENLPFGLGQHHLPGDLITDTGRHGSFDHHILSEKSLTVHQHIQEFLLVLVVKDHVLDNVVQLF